MTLRACIRGGASSIGGSCVEVEYDGHRLVLDLGLPLDSGAGDAVSLPPIKGLVEADRSLTGIVVSHVHPDHAGLLEHVHPEVPVFGPAQGQELVRAASRLAGPAYTVAPWQPIRHRATLRIGPFSVTPYRTDHSAFENYALLVAAGGRRILYSGDLRGHGRLQNLWTGLLGEPPRDVHAFLLEGTSLSRPDAPVLSERDVEEQLAQLCRQTSGIVLAFYSAQNIDRLVSVYRAAKKSGRTPVLDAYGALVAEATKLDTIPQASWDAVRVLLPRHQRRRIIANQEFKILDQLGPSRIYHDQLASQASKLVLTLRGSMLEEIRQADCLSGAAAVWSMWSGYLRREYGRKIPPWLAEHGVELHHIHASGHASREDLRALAEAVAPEYVVPIHTEAPSAYSQLYGEIRPYSNGEWWSV